MSLRSIVATVGIGLSLLAGACVSASAPPVAERVAATPQGPESVSDTSSELPERPGPRSETTGSVPHVQLDALLVGPVQDELRRRAFLLPGVEDRPSVISLPGTQGLWLTNEVELARPDVLPGGREFAHIHPDGSLHLWLPVARAGEVHDTKWGELHPWVEREGFWNGVVMIYTPETPEELDITIGLIADAYNFITGSNVTAAELS